MQDYLKFKTSTKILDLGRFGPTFQINLVFMKFGIQSRENMLILNILFGIDDLVLNFGPTMEVLIDFMKFGTKN